MKVNPISQDTFSHISHKFSRVSNLDEFCLLINDCQKFLYSDVLVPFSSKSIRHLAKLNQDKRYKVFEIKKKNGSNRQLNAPIPELKIFLQCVKLVFESIYKVHNCSHGFVAGRSVVSNAEVHINSNYVFNIDLKDFFHSIEIGRILNRFSYPPFNFRKDNGLEIVGNYIAWLACIEVQGSEKQLEEKKSVKVLPQGSPLSPIITNIICERLDRKLLELGRKTGARYSRYADDITFSSSINLFKSDSDFRKELEEIVIEEKFQINPLKTRLQNRKMRQNVTGITVNKLPNLPAAYVKEIRMWLYYLEKYNSNKVLKIFTLNHTSKKIKKTNISYTFEYFTLYLRGKLNYLGMVKGNNNAAFIKLRDRFQKAYSKHTGKIVASNDAEEFDNLISQSLENALTDISDITEQLYNESHGINSKPIIKGVKRNPIYPALSLNAEKFTVRNFHNVVTFEEKYQNKVCLNRSVYNNIDNYLNPMIANVGAKLRITIYNPSDDNLEWSDIPFLEYDELGYPMRNFGIKVRKSLSFQDFLDKYGNPEKGNKIYDDNVPMRVECLADDGHWYNIGLAIPSINWFGPYNMVENNPLKPGDNYINNSESNVSIQRNLFRNIRQRVLLGKSDFEVTERKQSRMKKIKDLNGKSLSLPLSVTDPNPSRYRIEGAQGDKAHMISGRFVRHTPYNICQDNLDKQKLIFSKNKKETRYGQAYRLMYFNYSKDSLTGDGQQIFKISQMSSIFNQTLLQKLLDNYYQLKLFVEVFRIKKILTQKNAIDNKKLTDIQIKLLKQHRYLFEEENHKKLMELKKILSSWHFPLDKVFLLRPNYIKSKEGDFLYVGHRKKLGMRIQVKYLNKNYPIIDMANLTVTNYVSQYSGRSGYNAMIEDVFCNPYVGFPIIDYTVRDESKPTRNVTVFATSPQIYFKPIN